MVKVQASARSGGGEDLRLTSLDPKLSPVGPSMTVTVLGCSPPEESYLSLSNQPSSGANQGDVSERGTFFKRVSFLSPWLFMPPWPPCPAPALGFPHQPAESWLLDYSRQ